MYCHRVIWSVRYVVIERVIWLVRYIRNTNGIYRLRVLRTDGRTGRVVGWDGVVGSIGIYLGCGVVCTVGRRKGGRGGTCRSEVEVVYMIYIIYRDFEMVVLSTCVKRKEEKKGGHFWACFFFDVVGM